MAERQGMQLSRDEITAVALELLNEGQPEPFSIRKLAAHLHTSPMNIYTYFSSKDDILASVQELISREFDDRPVPGEYWEDTLYRTLKSTRDTHLKYSNLYIVLQGWLPQLHVHSRRIFEIYKDQGMPLPVYRHMWNAVESFIIGFVSQEIKYRMAVLEPDEDADPETDWMRVLKNAYTDESFNDSIRLIIEGIRAVAAPDSCEWYTPTDTTLWTWQE